MLRQPPQMPTYMQPIQQIIIQTTENPNPEAEENDDKEDIEGKEESDESDNDEIVLKKEKNGEDGKDKNDKTKKKEDDGRFYKCAKCDKAYLSYPALYTHTKLKHIMSGEAPSITSGRMRGRPRKPIV
jgi:hypothetical protein